MANKLKATANSSIRQKALINIAAFTALAVFSLIMTIYDISTGRIFFGILFGIATAIFISLVLLRVNSVFGTYIEVSGDTLYMKSWVNDFLPYDINGGFMSDLKPSKTKLTEIPADEISLILVGTKDFVKRNAVSGKKLVRALYPYEHSSGTTKKNLISSMDIFYIETVDGDSSFMSVYGFDPKVVVDIISELYEINPDMYVKVGSRGYKKHIRRLQAELED